MVVYGEGVYWDVYGLVWLGLCVVVDFEVGWFDLFDVEGELFYLEFIDEDVFFDFCNVYVLSKLV